MTKFRNVNGLKFRQELEDRKKKREIEREQNRQEIHELAQILIAKGLLLNADSDNH